MCPAEGPPRIWMVSEKHRDLLSGRNSGLVGRTFDFGPGDPGDPADPADPADPGLISHLCVTLCFLTYHMVNKVEQSTNSIQVVIHGAS